jgi:hypothetical protein
MRPTRERGGELASLPRVDAKTDARQPILVTVCSTRECGGELASERRDDHAIGRNRGPVLAGAGVRLDAPERADARNIGIPIKGAEG